MVGYRYREVREQRGHALGNHDLIIICMGRSSHALRGFNYIRVDLAQAAFNKTRHKRERRDDERDYRGDCADRRADDKTGQWEDENHQNQKRHRTQKIYNNIENLHQSLRQGENAALFARDEQHAERQADNYREERGEQGDIYRLPDSQREIIF